jgi:DNA-directed RNA polymerase specialized sigma24 family protein
VTRLGHDLRAGDVARREEAARQLWLRFSGRLGAVVRHRVDPRLLVRAGVDDLVQSTFAGFFAAVPGLHAPPLDRRQLWRLLVCFTMRMVANTAEHHRADRRDVRRERPMAWPADDSAAAEPADARQLSPPDEAAARDEFGRLLAVLPEELQQIFALRLEGYTNAEIGFLICRVERTVELKMRAIRELLRPYLVAAASAGPVELPSH